MVHLSIIILITNNNGPARLLINESTPAPWLQIEVDKPGARVGIERQGAPTLWRRAHTDGSYASASSPILHFGLGTALPRRIVIEWPDGSQSGHEPGKLSRRLSIRR